VIGLARNVAYMYDRRGIRSNVIAPGGVATELSAGIEFDPEGAGITMSGLNLNPRNGEPGEIARGALFLASDDSSFVNGATIVADAGWSAY
jgi:NAD(P)-dependent dehydrogenase (short-subunit alcohol dehydrogenase family)